MNYKGVILVLIIVVLGIAGVLYFFTAQTTLPEPEVPGVVCTQDVKQCPDGSSVGRTGPKCEFASCPQIQVKEETTAKLNQKIYNGI